MKTKLYYFTVNDWDSFCIAYSKDNPGKFRMESVAFYGEDDPKWVRTWPTIAADNSEAVSLLKTVTTAAADTDYLLEDGATVRLYAVNEISL